MAALILTAASPAAAQSGNHGYCYVYGPDMSFQEFGTYLSANQGVTKRPGCDSGYNGRSVATQARQNLIAEARQQGIRVVEVRWPL